MKYITLIFTIIFTHNFSYGNNKTFRIVVKEMNTKKPIPFANIKITDINENVNYTTTNEGGIATISFESKKNNNEDLTASNITESDDLSIEISCVGFKTVLENISFSNFKEFYLEEDFLNLDQVVVTGTRTQKTVKDCPVLTQVVTANDIQKIDAVSVDEVLENSIPGLEFSMSGMGKQVSLQGLGAKYILFLIDGERIAGETGNNIDYNIINPDDIERIEYVKGASSTLYGSNAIGGVINIITKKLKKKWTANVDIRYEEKDSDDFDKIDRKNNPDGYIGTLVRNYDYHNINSNLTLGYQQKNFSSKTNFNLKTKDGMLLYNSDNIEFRNTKHKLDTSDLTVNGYSDYKITQNFGLKVGKVNFDVFGNYYNHKEYYAKAVKEVHKNFKSYKYGVRSYFDVNTKMDMTVSLSSDTYDKYRGAEDMNDQEYSQNYINAKIISNYNISKNHIVTSGLEYIRELLESDMFKHGDYLGKTADDIVLFIQDDLTLFDRFNIMAGLRTGYHSAYHNHFTPNISLKYDLGQFNLRTTYSRGFASPSLKQLYMNWDHLGMFIIKGNDNLKSESSNYYSTSLEYTSKNRAFNSTFTFFYSDIRDKIAGQWNDDQSEYHYINVDESKSNGINVLLKAKLVYGFVLKGSYAFTNRIESGTPNTLSDPAHSITSQLDYSFKRDSYSLNVNLSGKYSGVRDYNVKNDDTDKYDNIKYPDFSVWKLTVRQNFGRHIGVTLGVKNLFDYSSSNNINYNTYIDRRRFFAKLSYRL